MRYVYDDSEMPSISAFKLICFMINSSRCTWSLMNGRFSILSNFRLSSSVSGTARIPNFRISDGNIPSHRTAGTANDSAKFDIDCGESEWWTKCNSIWMRETLVPMIHGDKWAWFQLRTDQRRWPHRSAMNAALAIYTKSTECLCPGNLFPVRKYYKIFLCVMKRRESSKQNRLTVIKMQLLFHRSNRLFCNKLLKTVSFSTSRMRVAVVLKSIIPAVRCGSVIPSNENQHEIITHEMRYFHNRFRITNNE